LENKKIKIAVIGLGYVGLPLAVLFSKKYNVVGFDSNKSRVKELNILNDRTNEVDKIKLQEALENNLEITDNHNIISKCNIYIITVPTPIDINKKPDLSYLLNATKETGKVLTKGDIVIFESTVYPGCTEEECVPILEKTSSLTYNKDFFCGYSPERINPGDKKNTIEKIVKVTSGSSKYSADLVDNLYKSVITAGTHKAGSIKIAEASKAIENAQRDLNISFVNELSIIFDKMEIDTTDVLEAASTKWNFLNFRPGLVGGHCISVDPYYLTYKAKSLGYQPDVILSGRQVNENMAEFVAHKLLNKMIEKSIEIVRSNIIILGITYKENCPDTRNTKIPEVYKHLKEKGARVSVYDPYASFEDVKKDFNIKMISNFEKYDGIILAVSHSDFKKIDYDKLKRNSNSVIFDVKSFLNKNIVDARL
jgi:UDP-N-acetyl-D-galactosamine dehydrogenase